MKRLFILASAAIVALASCAKTEVVYDGAQQEIAFKKITGVMTKVGTLGDGLETTMRVFAFDDENKSYFTYGSAQFQPNDNEEWVAANGPIYWPLTGSLDFICIAPYIASASVSNFITNDDESKTYDKYTLTADITNNSDFMYGTMVTTSSKTNTAIPVDLRHALAKISVSITSDLEGIIVSSVELTSAGIAAAMTLKYYADDDEETVNDERLSFYTTSTSNVELWGEEESMEKDTPSANTCYVIPSNQTKLVMKYQLPNTTEKVYTHTFNSNDKWLDGHLYTYNIKICANEIKFNPTVTGWEDEDSETPTEEIVMDPTITTGSTPTPTPTPQIVE